VFFARTSSLVQGELHLCRGSALSVLKSELEILRFEICALCFCSFADGVEPFSLPMEGSAFSEFFSCE